VTEISERAISARVPALTRETLRVVRRRQPLTVLPGTSIAECLRAIQRSGVGDSVLVADGDGRLLGVLTERDIFGRIVGEPVRLDRPVESMMNREPRTLRLGQTVREAIALMETGRYRNVPIVDDDGRILGIVRQVDILKYLAEAFPESLLNLPPRPHQTMKESEGA
jgi:CBS domain-containing protein